MYSDDHNASPVNPLPAMVVVFSLALAGVELYLQAAEHGYIGGRMAVGARLNAVTSYGFFDSVFSWMVETHRAPFEHAIRFISYAFVHANFTQASFAVVMLLAIGKMVAEAFSNLGFVIIFVLSTVFGALAYGVFLDTNIPLIGAFPAVYGMIGGLTFMLWTRARVSGESQLKAFSLILFLMGIQIVFKFVFGGGDEWVADVAGFLTGFVLSFVLAPDGGSRITGLLEKLRTRR